MKLDVLHRDDLKLGGFAGLREHRLVLDSEVGRSSSDAWPGIGSFVYVADSRFVPHGETELLNTLSRGTAAMVPVEAWHRECTSAAWRSMGPR